MSVTHTSAVENFLEYYNQINHKHCIHEWHLVIVGQKLSNAQAVLKAKLGWIRKHWPALQIHACELKMEVMHAHLNRLSEED
jgi:hypothetical protein